MGATFGHATFGEKGQTKEKEPGTKGQPARAWCTGILFGKQRLNRSPGHEALLAANINSRTPRFLKPQLSGIELCPSRTPIIVLDAFGEDMLLLSGPEITCMVTILKTTEGGQPKGKNL